MSNKVEYFQKRSEFFNSLNENPGLIFVKLEKHDCAPCKIIEPDVLHYFSNMPDTVRTITINIEESFDVFAFYKTKKIVQGAPTILCYHKDNTHYVPDDVFAGSNKEELKIFFNRCLEELN